jgi:polar amino acid transport system permease protein
MRVFGWTEFLFILVAVRWTVLLSLVAFAGGIIGGLGIALMKTSQLAPLRWLATLYIRLFQGTPLLMQLFLIYYGLAVVVGLRIDAWPAVAIAFTAYAAAFLGDIWRGCIEAVPREQWEAAEALSLRRFATMRLVILPQAVRIAIPPTVGFLVQLIKGTSVASIIGFVELTRAGQLMTNVTFQPMIIYPLVAALYFALCWPLSMLSQALEKRMDAARQTVATL